MVLTSYLFGYSKPAPELFPVPQQTAGEDPLLKDEWHLKTTRTLGAWALTEGSPNTKIAIVDSGIDYNHPDLTANIYRKASEFPVNGLDKDGNGFKDDIIGWDYVLNSYLPYDRSGHGTFMASVIAARKDNSLGMAGVCPKCSLMALRFIDGNGFGDTEDAIEGIYYAAKEGASVINISFAGHGYDKDLEKAIEFAGTKNTVVVVSASNDGENLDKVETYPAKFQMSHLLTVGSSNHRDELANGSNWGPKTVSLLAPGEEVLGIWEGKYDTGSGTSQAAAVASGVVGLVRSANSTLSANQVVQIIRKTVRKIPEHVKITQSSGIIDAKAAVECARDVKLACLVD